MKNLRMLVVLWLCLLIIISLNATTNTVLVQDVFSFEVIGDIQTEAGKVKVTYLLELEAFGTISNAPKPASYDIYMDFGDGSHHRIELPIETGAVIGLQREPEGEKNGVSMPRKLIYTYTHTYTRVPQYPAQVFATVIYTDDYPPGGKKNMHISGTDFDDIIEKTNEQNLTPVNNIPTDTILNNLISFSITNRPVPEEYTVGTLDYKRGENEAFQSGYIFLFYNMAEFVQGEFRIGTDSIRTYFGENVENLSFVDCIQNFRNQGFTNIKLPLNDFDKVIQIQFDNLESEQLRRITIPIFCPSTMRPDTTKEVAFLGYLVGEGQLGEFLAQEDLITISSTPGTRFTPFVPVPLADNNFRADHAENPRTSDVNGVGISILSSHDQRHFPNAQANKIFDYTWVKTRVDAAVDPNSIDVVPKCFSDRNMMLEFIIGFENEGTGYADRVEIEVEFEGKLQDDAAIVSYHPQEADVSINKSQLATNKLNIVLDNFYLPAPQQVTQTANHFGHVTFHIMTDNVAIGDNVEAKATIRFFRGDTMHDSVVTIPSAVAKRKRGCTPKKFPIFVPMTGFYIGMQTPSPIGDFSLSTPNDNLRYGIYWNMFRIKKVIIGTEVGISNLGMQRSIEERYRIQSLEANFYATFPLQDRWWGTIGGGAHFRQNVQLNGNTIAVSDTDFSKRLYNTFAEGNYHFNNIRLVSGFSIKPIVSVRANAYINPTIGGVTQSLLFAPQVNLKIRF